MPFLKSSVLNLSANFLLIFSRTIALLVTKKIIEVFGSEMNGLIGLVNNILIALSVFEGGITAVVIANLYKPYTKERYTRINCILSATRVSLNYVGTIIFIIGVIISIVYAKYSDFNINFFEYYTIFILAIFTSVFNLVFTTRYMIMFQVAHKEYVVNTIISFIELIAQLFYILILYYYKDIIILRISLSIYFIIRGIIIYKFFNKHFPNANFYKTPDFKVIKESKDILFQKIAGIVYTSLPLILISIFINLESASIYFVFTSIFLIFKNIIQAVIMAPLNGIGQMLSTDLKKASSIFYKYEVLTLMIIMIVVTFSLVSLKQILYFYTGGFDITGYMDYSLILLFSLLFFSEMSHIPSGQVINLSGNYRMTRKPFVIFILLYFTLSIILVNVLGIKGILAAGIISNIYLNYIEVFYCHSKILKSISITKVIIVCILIFFSMSFIGYNYVVFENISILNSIKFISILIATSGIVILIFYLTDKKVFKTFREVLVRLKNKKL